MPLSLQHIAADTPMGAHPVGGGTTFRVWAPQAAAVHVVGRFSGRESWIATEANALTRGDLGHWLGFVPGAGEGDQYRFYVKGAGAEGYKRDPYARELTAMPAYPAANCVIRRADTYPWQADGWRPPAFNDLILYQLHIGTWRGPDLRSRVATVIDVLRGLDYLADLGVNAVQFLPMAEYAAPRSMGYGGVDLFSPEMDYTVEALSDEDAAFVAELFRRRGRSAPSKDVLAIPINQIKAMVDLFHLTGIAVLFDIVLNHAGAEARGHADGLWFFDLQPQGDPNRSLYFTEQDHAGPVFAFAKEEIRQFLIDNTNFFVNEYRIDGYRYDQATVIDQSSNRGWALLQDITATVRTGRPEAIHIAEYWNVNPWVVRRREEGGAGFDATWSDGLREAVRRALAAASHGRDAHVGLHAVADAIARTDFPARWKRVEYVESHDEVYRDRGKARIPKLADPSNPRSWYARSRSRVATGLLLTSPGIPMLFMGQEVLEDKQWSDNPAYFSDVLIDWDGLSAADPAMADHLRFTRELVEMRRRHPALRGEGVRIVVVDEYNRVLAFQRWIEGRGRDVMIVVSLNEETLNGYRIGMPRDGRWIEAFNSDVYDRWVNRNAAGNGGEVWAHHAPMHEMPSSASMTIPANSVLLLVTDVGD
ncbi:alpha amylase C-terminal domain-containing protein [Methylorubrum sp. SB2]|uniref:alpha amylase C-terminal domain-containing protein n=1 Tax=Methylorubrum subtropicum TaxID=3138812 RepID=UPI00313B23CD